VKPREIEEPHVAPAGPLHGTDGRIAYASAPSATIHLVRSHGGTIPLNVGARSAMGLAVAAVACMVCVSSTATFTSAPVLAAGVRAGAVHYACSAPNSSRVPCRFSTPSGNIRCLWTPTPDSVACELLASGRAYRLRPTGRAKAIKLRLTRRGETLPTSQQIVFPQSLSCHDTNTTMSCNQDFGLGEFKLAPTGSRGA